ncbi:uncharacterized protein EI90DRAFT_3066402 [Cantharellus anzutake]|uniref:uncharacterized protein n=1 Tax=Cantharellus anzutake TaxID=1750568 RepID=UPI001906F035|nr:uncharacterized protein EI90DRAFT_3066402 [Cantharellus anzutake]KAF8327942.1 hypothetical protein EI90DRAFT_3066402 [Cantharellus anzutake]
MLSLPVPLFLITYAVGSSSEAIHCDTGISGRLVGYSSDRETLASAGPRSLHDRLDIANFLLWKKYWTTPRS